MNKYTADRYHDLSVGHRVVGHEGKCRHLHGHNYRIHFKCASEGIIPKPPKVIRDFGMCTPIQVQELDTVGRVIDFGVIKEKLCMWLEENWDHKFLAWEQDPLIKAMDTFVLCDTDQDASILEESFVYVPFNPTAENMAEYLVNVIGPQQLLGTGVYLKSVVIEETRKCSVTYGK